MPDLERKTITSYEDLQDFDGEYLVDVIVSLQNLVKKHGEDTILEYAYSDEDHFRIRIPVERLETVDEQFIRIKSEERTEERQRKADLELAERLQKKWNVVADHLKKEWNVK